MAIPEDTLPAGQSPALPTQQRPMGAPVVNAPGLPSMERVGEVRTVVRNITLPLMEPTSSVEKAGENLMVEVHRMGELPPWPATGPQKPKEDQATPAPSEGYVRIEFHVEDGRLSVVGAKEVAGPLAIPSAVIRGHVYEVLIGDQQIALGSLPDVGLRRAFANRDVPGPEGKHRFFQTPTFDFVARIPRIHVTAENLTRMIVLLHNVQEAPDRLVPDVALQKQPGIVTTEVARFPGLGLEQLPAGVRPQFERILGGNRTPP
jgi:hypothetical protein